MKMSQKRETPESTRRETYVVGHDSRPLYKIHPPIIIII